MFCPSCGKDNPQDRRFCGNCGTNLEAVSRALTEDTRDFFSRTEAGFDHFIAKYSEHVFKSAPAAALDRRVGKSWQLLGQGVLTSLIDLIMMTLMWNFLPLRFLILLISTPMRLLSERSGRPRRVAAELENRENRQLPEASLQWLPDSVPSVSEHTTEKLGEHKVAIQERNSEKR